MSDFKEIVGKIFKGCGCLSIGFFVLLVIVAIFSDDDESTDTTDEETPKTEQVEKKDSVIVNEPLAGDPYKELDDLIGLESVKKEVRSLANFVKLQKQREAKGLKTAKVSYHLVFYGSPGTGKTTVARIIGRIYKDLGVLKKGHTVETDRSGLVAKYLGQTALKTDTVVQQAIHGVLFIDEAYALVPEDGNGQDYGQEAISTLLKRMEDYRDSLVVIIAGYRNEMQRFIDSNPGLQSRFNRYIDFPDYTGAELTDIFKMYMKKNQYTLAPDAENYLREQLDYAVAHKDRNFGNARFARNVFEKSIQQQANRLAGKTNLSKEELTELTVADLQEGFAARTNIGK
jgi:SpoVK/Ycf46/Vps4 family AAA+-type ATPase